MVISHLSHKACNKGYHRYFDLHLEIDSEGWLRTKLYDKRDDINNPIVNFPFIYSNIPAAPAYEVYISQLIRYFRACGSCRDFLDRWLLLTRKLMNQGFLLVKLKSSLRKVYGHHHLWPLWNICVTNDHGYIPLVNTSRSFPDAWHITRYVTRLTQRVSLVEQELPTLPGHLSSPPVFSVVRVTRSLVLCVCFVNICLSFCTFSFDNCVQILITPFAVLKIKYFFPVFSDFMWKKKI